MKKITAKVKTLKEILEIEEVITHSPTLLLFEGDYAFKFELLEYVGFEIEINQTIKMNTVYDYKYEGFGLKKEWLTDIKEEIDWSKVPIDTPILVWNENYIVKRKRYFTGLGISSGKITTWVDGCTSWSTNDIKCYSSWDCAELAEVAK